MKIIYTSDLHSNKNLYTDLRELVDKVKADILIIGGDLFSHTHDVKDQLAFFDKFLKDYLNDFIIPVFIIPGNTDWPIAIEKISNVSKIGILDLGEKCVFGSFYMQGYPYSIPSPFRNKDYEKRDLISDYIILQNNKKYYVTDNKGNIIYVEKDYLNKLTSIEEDLKDKLKNNSIWVMHNPPYGCSIDLTSHAGHIGSKAIRNEIEEKKPTLTLHGHVHESHLVGGSWIDKIGNTICINPGIGDKLHAVIIKFDNNNNVNKIYHREYGTYMFH